MAARPDPNKRATSAPTRHQTAPASSPPSSDTHQGGTSSQKRHEARAARGQGAVPGFPQLPQYLLPTSTEIIASEHRRKESEVLLILSARSLHDQAQVSLDNRRHGRSVLGGAVSASRLSGIDVVRLLRWEKGTVHLNPVEFARLDRAVRSALAARKYGP